MSAPDVVVRAVQEADDSHHTIPCPEHWDYCCCICGRHHMTGAGARAHHIEAVADAAHKASLEWAAEQMNGRYAQPWAVDVLRRWADESEASRG